MHHYANCRQNSNAGKSEKQFRGMNTELHRQHGEPNPNADAGRRIPISPSKTNAEPHNLISADLHDSAQHRILGEAIRPHHRIVQRAENLKATLHLQTIAHFRWHIHVVFPRRPAEEAKAEAAIVKT